MCMNSHIFISVFLCTRAHSQHIAIRLRTDSCFDCFPNQTKHTWTEAAATAKKIELLRLKPFAKNLHTYVQPERVIHCIRFVHDTVGLHALDKHEIFYRQIECASSVNKNKWMKKERSNGTPFCHRIHTTNATGAHIASIRVRTITGVCLWARIFCFASFRSPLSRSLPVNKQLDFGCWLSFFVLCEPHPREIGEFSNAVSMLPAAQTICVQRRCAARTAYKMASTTKEWESLFDCVVRFSKSLYCSTRTIGTARTQLNHREIVGWA